MTISMSLIAVFIPLLLMGGIVGRLFREFAVTLSTAIVVSMVISPDHHADDVRPSAEEPEGREAGPHVAGVGEGLSMGAGRLPQEPALGAGEPGLVLTVLVLIIASQCG